MATIKLNAASLKDAANRMEDAANRIEKALNSIDAIMSDTNSVWDDANSKKYLARYEELKETFPQFKAEVHSYGDFLNKVVDTYQREYITPVSESVD